MEIRKSLTSKEVDIEIHFLIAVKPLFDEFMTKFQKKEPMIHLLYPSCDKLLEITMGKLLRSRPYTKKREEH